MHQLPARSICVALVGLILNVIPLDAAAGDCQGDRLACEFGAAIGVGLAHAARLEAGTGFANGVDVEANGPALQLAFRSFGWNQRSRSYQTLTPDERARVDRIALRLVDGDPTLTGAPVVDPVLTAQSLMGLRSFIRHGGPILIGEVDAIAAIETGARALIDAQIQPPDPAAGGWRSPDGRADAVTTVVALAGIEAAMSVVDRLPDAAPAAAGFVAAHVNPDGGHGPGASDPVTTASAHLVAVRGRLDLGGPVVQGQLRWLLAQHPRLYAPGPARFGGGLYAWALTQGLIWLGSGGGTGGLEAYDFGTLDPMSMGYPDMVPHERFDLDWALVQGWHPAHGPWTGPDDGRLDGFYAVLALSMPWGVVDIDHDGDGLLSIDDNCPRIANPAQDDVDEDGIGDACDNCPATVNRDQADADEDGIGDVCEPPDAGVDAEIDAMADAGPDAMLDMTRDATPAPRDGTVDAIPDALDSRTLEADSAPDATPRPDADGEGEAPHTPSGGCLSAWPAHGSHPLGLLTLLLFSARLRPRTRRARGPDTPTAGRRPIA